MTLEKETFGPILRGSRERQGVTLEQIAAETKLGVELWADLEDSNLSRWPKQIYARSYVRDYALRIGLDADEVVNEFCRLFPEWGNRRAEPLMREHAAIVSHDLAWMDLPQKEERRASDRLSFAQPVWLGRHRTRVAGAGIDLGATMALAGVALLLGLPFWPSLALSALGYSLASTLIFSQGFGVRAFEWLVRVAGALPSARRRLVSTRVEGG